MIPDFTANGYRLPTEAEWEFASRGGKISKKYNYSGGNNLGSVGWYEDNSGEEPNKVGTKLPNEIGIYDMSGNVIEWCWDWFGEFQMSEQTNPTGPSSGSGRVVRGGHFIWEAIGCRITQRNQDNPEVNGITSGFRLARSK